MAVRVLPRIIAGVGVVAGVVSLTFLLLHIAPGDPAIQLAGPTATPEQIAAQRAILGLDRPLPVQYLAWLAAFLRGDWGTSIASGRRVTEILGTAWPATILLVGLSLALSYLFGILVGAVQARLGRRADLTISAVSLSLYAMPGYWLGLMLVLVFTYRLGWLPAFGAEGVEADFLSPWAQVLDRVRHLALPLATLTMIGLGGASRYVRASVLDTRDLPFVATARAKGLSENRVLFGHVLRNALIPVVTLLGLSLPALFSGAVFVEGVFAWPGVGRTLLEAVAARDYPVVMAATTVSALLVVAGNIVADAMLAWVDPRLRGT